MPGIDYDVLIAGGGPAGLSTALHLAEASPSLARRSAVLEAKHHPRDKPCAGGVTPGAMHYLRRLGLDPASISHAPVRDARVRMGAREVVVRGDPHCFHVVRRRELDGTLANALLERRGPELLQGARVRGVRRIDGGFEVETDVGTLRCRALVAADGASSVVRKSLWPEGAGTRCVTGLQCTLPATGMPPSEALFDFSPIRSGILGYTWDFPTLGSERSVGIFAHGRPVDATRYLRRHLAETGGGSCDVPLQGARVRIFEPSRQLSEHGVLLTGDAAGIDPLFGEGIGLALGQGEVAARNLLRGFAKGDLRFASYTAELLGHKVGRCLVMRHRRYRVLSAPASRLILRPLWRLVVSVGEAATFDPR